MSSAIDMLVGVLVSKPRIKGETHIQFDSMQKARGTTTAWKSSPQGIQEGFSILSGIRKTMLTWCQTQQKWSGLFLRGAKI